MYLYTTTVLSSVSTNIFSCVTLHTCYKHTRNKNQIQLKVKNRKAFVDTFYCISKIITVFCTWKVLLSVLATYYHFLHIPNVIKYHPGYFSFFTDFQRFSGSSSSSEQQLPTLAGESRLSPIFSLPFFTYVHISFEAKVKHAKLYYWSCGHNLSI